MLNSSYISTDKVRGFKNYLSDVIFENESSLKKYYNRFLLFSTTLECFENNRNRNSDAAINNLFLLVRFNRNRTC